MPKLGGHHIIYTDNGCKLHPKCTTCPLPKCAEEVGEKTALLIYAMSMGASDKEAAKFLHLEFSQARLLLRLEGLSHATD